MLRHASKFLFVELRSVAHVMSHEHAASCLPASLYILYLFNSNVFPRLLAFAQKFYKSDFLLRFMRAELVTPLFFQLKKYSR